MGALDRLSDDVWSGPIVLAGSTEIDSDAGTLAITRGIGVQGSDGPYTLTFGGAGDIVVGGAQSGCQGIGANVSDVTMNGSGTLALEAPDAYAGATTVNNGSLIVTTSAAVPAGRTVTGSYNSDASWTADLSVSAVDVGPGATLDLGGCDVTSAGPATVATGGITDGTLAASSFLVQGGAITAALAGSGGLTMSGNGTLLLAGQNIYTGGTDVVAGTVQIAAGGALGSGDLTVDGTLDMNGYSLAVGALSGGGTIESSSGSAHAQHGGGPSLEHLQRPARGGRRTIDPPGDRWRRPGPRRRQQLFGRL